MEILDLEELKENKSEVITCINQETGCATLPEDIKTNMEAVKDYIQIGDLQKSKISYF